MRRARGLARKALSAYRDTEWRSRAADLLTNGEHSAALADRNRLGDLLGESVARRHVAKAVDDLVGARPFDDTVGVVLVHDTFARLLGFPYVSERVREAVR